MGRTLDAWREIASDAGYSGEQPTSTVEAINATVSALGGEGTAQGIAEAVTNLAPFVGSGGGGASFGNIANIIAGVEDREDPWSGTNLPLPGPLVFVGDYPATIEPGITPALAVQSVSGENSIIAAEGFALVFGMGTSRQIAGVYLMTPTPGVNPDESTWTKTSYPHEVQTGPTGSKSLCIKLTNIPETLENGDSPQIYIMYDQS